MTDKPRKTLSITRKPASGGTGKVSRTGKRIIRREDLPEVKTQSRKTSKPKAGKGGGKKKPARKPNPKKPVISPSDLKARELNDRLNGFPVWRDYRPLAIGIDKDVFRLVNDEHFPGASKGVVQKALKIHTGHPRYLQAIRQGGGRFHLDGREEGEINAYQQQLAAERLAKRQAAKE